MGLYATKDVFLHFLGGKKTKIDLVYCTLDMINIDNIPKFLVAQNCIKKRSRNVYFFSLKKDLEDNSIVLC